MPSPLRGEPSASALDSSMAARYRNPGPKQIGVGHHVCSTGPRWVRRHVEPAFARCRRRSIPARLSGLVLTAIAGHRARFSERLGFYLSALLVLSALTLGGRSAGTPLSEALFQILAIWLLIWMAMARRTAAESRLSTAAVTLVLATLVAAFLQLVPLPYGLWATTSGAPDAAAVLDAAGIPARWRPLTLDASATRETILALLPPVALFFAMLELNAEDRQKLAIIIVVVTAASIVLGLLQFASQTSSLYPYKTTHQGFSVGFFTNRNHQADLTLIGALLASALYRSRRDSMPQSPVLGGLIGAAVFALVVVNLVAAASRTGLALAVPTLVACALIVLGARKAGRALLIAAAAVVTIGAMLVFVRPDVVESVLGRFGADSDLRFWIWPVTIELIGQYLPFGSGLGTFVPVFETAEELNMVSDRYVNHAHNDYLEIALEMGVAGIVLMLAFALLFVWAVVAALRRDWPTRYVPLTAAAGAGIAVLLAHSLVDYSLRTSALAITFAVLMGSLMPLPMRIDRGAGEVSGAR